MLQSRHLINFKFIDTQASELYEGMVTETDADIVSNYYDFISCYSVERREIGPDRGNQSELYRTCARSYPEVNGRIALQLGRA